MNATFTETDILRFIYGECTPKEAAAISKELQKNFELRAFYDRMMETRLHLDEIDMEPDASTIDLIMEYSASHHDSLEHH